MSVRQLVPLLAASLSTAFTESISLPCFLSIPILKILFSFAYIWVAMLTFRLSNLCAILHSCMWCYWVVKLFLVASTHCKFISCSSGTELYSLFTMFEFGEFGGRWVAVTMMSLLRRGLWTREFMVLSLSSLRWEFEEFHYAWSCYDSCQKFSENSCRPMEILCTWENMQTIPP